MLNCPERQDMERIETKEEMIAWAQAVNSGITVKQKCTYQDIWAHSNPATLNRLFIECDGHRNVITCSVYNTMAYETVEALLLHWAQVKAGKIIDKEMEHYNTEIMKRESALNKREASFKDCLKGYWKRIQDLRKRDHNLTFKNNGLSKRNTEILVNNRKLEKDNNRLTDQAFKLETLRRIIREQVKS